MYLVLLWQLDVYGWYSCLFSLSLSLSSVTIIYKQSSWNHLFYVKWDICTTSTWCNERSTGLAWYWTTWEVTARSTEYREEVGKDGTQSSHCRLHGNKLKQISIGSVYVTYCNSKYKNAKSNEQRTSIKRELQFSADCNPQLGTASVVTINIFYRPVMRLTTVLWFHSILEMQ